MGVFVLAGIVSIAVAGYGGRSDGVEPVVSVVAPVEPVVIG